MQAHYFSTDNFYCSLLIPANSWLALAILRHTTCLPQLGGGASITVPSCKILRYYVFSRPRLVLPILRTQLTAPSCSSPVTVGCARYFSALFHFSLLYLVVHKISASFAFVIESVIAFFLTMTSFFSPFLRLSEMIGHVLVSVCSRMS